MHSAPAYTIAASITHFCQVLYVCIKILIGVYDIDCHCFSKLIMILMGHMTTITQWSACYGDRTSSFPKSSDLCLYTASGEWVGQGAFRVGHPWHWKMTRPHSADALL